MMQPLFKLTLLIAIELLMQAAIAQVHPCPGAGPGEVVVGVQPGNGTVAQMLLCDWDNSIKNKNYSPPPIRWADRYGAIVFGVNSIGNNAVLGVSENKINSEAAKNAAMLDCSAQGGRSCKISLVYHNQCAAVISGSIAFSAGGPTIEKAVQVATDDCKKNSSRPCSVYYTACSMAVQVQ
jgi:hypothetical protein